MTVSLGLRFYDLVSVRALYNLNRHLPIEL